MLAARIHGVQHSKNCVSGFFELNGYYSCSQAALYTPAVSGYLTFKLYNDFGIHLNSISYLFMGSRLYYSTFQPGQYINLIMEMKHVHAKNVHASFSRCLTYPVEYYERRLIHHGCDLARQRVTDECREYTPASVVYIAVCKGGHA